MTHREATNYFLNKWEKKNTSTIAFEYVISDFFLKKDNWTEEEVDGHFKNLTKFKKKYKGEKKDTVINLFDPLLIHLFKDINKHIELKSNSGIGNGEHFFNFLYDTDFSQETTADLEDQNYFYELKGVLKNGKKINNAPIRFNVIERWSGIKDNIIYEKDNDIKKVKISLTSPDKKTIFDISNLIFVFMNLDEENNLHMIFRTAKEVENYVNKVFLKTKVKGNRYNLARVTDWNHGIRFNFDQFNEIPKFNK